MQESRFSKSPKQSLHTVRGASRLTSQAELETAPAETQKCQILAKKGFLVAKDTTSGVVLLVYSKEFQLGVLLHLPPSPLSGNISNDVQGQLFAKSAISMILAEFGSLGVNRNELVTYAIGGSATDATPAVSKVMLQRMVWSYGLSLSGCDLGGKQIRSIWMDVESGRTIVRSEPMLKNALAASSTLTAAS